MKREYDDTLILLAEQDAKITGYKQRLRVHNEQVSDDEDLVHANEEQNHTDAHEQFNLHSSNV